MPFDGEVLIVRTKLTPKRHLINHAKYIELDVQATISAAVLGSTSKFVDGIRTVQGHP